MARPRRPIRAWELPEERPVPQGQAAVLEAALDRALVRSLGALPALLPLCEGLGLRAIINRRCYPDGEAPEDLDVGLVVLVLALNRLQAPAPLVHVEDWVARSALGGLLGIDAGQCNDDRLARTPDRLLAHLDAIWQELIVAAVVRFGVGLRALCYDLTSIAFCGAYEEAELVRYGYSRDHRPDRKQIELAATVSAAGGIPLDYRALAGNVADRAGGEPAAAAGAAGAAAAAPAGARLLGDQRPGAADRRSLGLLCREGAVLPGAAGPGAGARGGARAAGRRRRGGAGGAPAALSPPARGGRPGVGGLLRRGAGPAGRAPRPRRAPAGGAGAGGLEPGQGAAGCPTAGDPPPAAGAGSGAAGRQAGPAPLHHRRGGAQAPGRPAQGAPRASSSPSPSAAGRARASRCG